MKPKNNDTTLMMKLPSPLKDRIRAEATRNGLAISTWIKVIISAALDQAHKIDKK